MCTIGSNQEVEIDLDFTITASAESSILDLKPCFPFLEVGTGEFVVEVDFDIGHSLHFVQQDFV